MGLLYAYFLPDWQDKKGGPFSETAKNKDTVNQIYAVLLLVMGRDLNLHESSVDVISRFTINGTVKSVNDNFLDFSWFWMKNW